MKICKQVMVSRSDVQSVICDICKKEYDIKDAMEIQEFTNISFIGGFSSIFGDGNKIECDICQYCLQKVLGQHLTIN